MYIHVYIHTVYITVRCSSGESRSYIGSKLILYIYIHIKIYLQVVIYM